MPPPKTHALTLLEAHAALADCPELSPRQKQQLRSAVLRFAKLCNRNAGDIIADPGAIRVMIGKVSWQLASLSKGSWANLRSSLTLATKSVGIMVERGRRNFKLSSHWEDLLAAIPDKDRITLRRFAGWCSVHGEHPRTVNAAVFASFLLHLREETIHRAPKEKWHEARRSWNRMVEARSDQAYPHIEDTDPMGWRGLSWPQFPNSLQAELAVYRTRMLQSDPFNPEHRQLKPVTVENYDNAFRGYLSKLVQDGDSPATFATIRDCVDVNLAKRGLRLCQSDRTDLEARASRSKIAIAIISLARFVNLGDEQLKQLGKLVKILRYVPAGMSEKNKARLAPLESEDIRRRFMSLPLVVARRMAHIVKPTHAQAAEMQMAIMLELLLHVPMRIKNLAVLDLDKHVYRPPAGTTGSWRISIVGEEVKNGQALDAGLMPTTSAMLQRYLEVFRPVQLKGPSNAIFISRSGLGKGTSALGQQFSRFIRRELGLIVNPHLMRHFAAFAYLKAEPGHYEAVRQMLGHKQIEPPRVCRRLQLPNRMEPS
jgi:integrase